MKKSANYYKKALAKYYSGDLEKALYLCEKGISSSLKNAAAINLKGLLMYIKGNMSEAKGLWRLNKDYNKDEVAKKYLESLKDDEQRLLMYKESESLIEQMKFKEALDLLLECKKSDFNLIAVHNALTDVYIHLGQFEEAKACIDKVLEVDKNNEVAKENRKLLVDYRVIENKPNYKRLAFILSSFAVVAVALLIIVPKLDIDNKVKKNTDSAIKVSDKKESDNNQLESSKQLENTAEKNSSKQEEDSKKVEKIAFPTEELNVAIKNKDYNTLYRILTSYKIEDLEEEDKTYYNQAKAIMEKKGVEYFYTKARDFHTKNQYKEAVEQYAKVEHFGEKHYFYESTIYMMANCYKELNEVDKAINYFEKYISLDVKKNYEGEALYKLVLLYKDTDINKAKEYAKQIRERFKNTIYNNSIVQKVLNSK